MFVYVYNDNRHDLKTMVDLALVTCIIHLCLMLWTNPNHSLLGDSKSVIFINL